MLQADEKANTSKNSINGNKVKLLLIIIVENITSLAEVKMLVYH